MDNEPVAAVSAVVLPVVAGAGLYCEDVTVSGQGRGRKITVVVDLPENALGGVSMDTVAEVTSALSQALDDADVIPGAYNLEVTTPGISRPLTEARHFKRARGRLVRVCANDGAIVGRVRGVVDGAVVLACADGERSVPLTGVTEARMQVEFTPPPRDFEIIGERDAAHRGTGTGEEGE